LIDDAVNGHGRLSERSASDCQCSQSSYIDGKIVE
jgi:hypothetical protein